MARLRGPLHHLSQTWLEATRLPRERLIVAVGCAVVMSALLFARMGTLASRMGALAVLVLAVTALVLARRRDKKQWRDDAWVVRRIAGGVDAERAERALRALSLVDREGKATTPGVSSELARMHVVRTLEALPGDRIAAAARRHGTRLGIVGVVFALAAVGLFVSSPWGAFEGADVLFATRGVAPLAMRWIGDTELEARPPDYLHQPTTEQSPYRPSSLPRGTLLTFRGVATHDGRKLALS
ncbi:MAG: hypothetical protein ABI551_03145, partial [Polyangiaceae bacterium]